VVRAESTVGRAGAALDRHVGRMGAFSIRPVGCELLIHVIGAKVKFLGLTMLNAGLGHEDLAFTFEYSARKDTVALRADALGPADETPDLRLPWL